MIEKSIRDHLANDITVTSLIATYDFGNGPEPAIFTATDPPRDSGRPCIQIGQVAAADFGCRDSRGAEIWADVVVWDNRPLSAMALRDASVAVWESMNRACVGSDYGHVGVLCVADAPIRTSDVDGFPGYNIRCRVVVIEP